MSSRVALGGRYRNELPIVMSVSLFYREKIYVEDAEECRKLEQNFHVASNCFEIVDNVILIVKQLFRHENL